MESVMLDSKGYPQLVDFTLSKKLAEAWGRTFTLCGVPEYMAPEQVQKMGYGTAPDMWAIGVLCYEMLLGRTPFALGVDAKTTAVETLSSPQGQQPTVPSRIVERRHSNVRLVITTGQGELEATIATYKAIMSFAQSSERKLNYHDSTKKLSNEAKEFIEDLLEPDPGQRLCCRGGGIEEVEVYAWFDGFKFDAFKDGAIDAPFQSMCGEELPKLFDRDGVSTFEAPPYVGDSLWCEDWDETCTIGVEQGTTGKK